MGHIKGSSLVGFVFLFSGAAGVVGGETTSKTPFAVEEAERIALSGIDASLIGDQRESADRFAKALSLDGNCQLARWHSGQVHWNGTWMTPDEVAEALAADDKYKSYLERRDGLSGIADDELLLAEWCKGQAFDDLAKFHFSRVLQNSSATAAQRNTAAQSLGLVQYQGRWTTAEQVTALKEQAESRSKAADRWTRRVRQWAGTLSRNNDDRILQVREEMAGIDDLEIIPVLEQHFSSVHEKLAVETVRWLDRKKEFPATESLVRHAIGVPWPHVAEVAAQALAGRSPHDYVPTLLDQIIAPVDMRRSIAVGQGGNVVQRFDLYQAGRDTNQLARWDIASTRANRWRTVTPVTANTSNDPAAVPSTTTVITEVAQIQRLDAIAALSQSLAVARDVAAVNDAVTRHNQRIFAVLRTATYEQFTDDPEAWWSWWTEYNDEYEMPKETEYTYNRRYSRYDYGGNPAPRTSSPGSGQGSVTPVSVSRGRGPRGSGMVYECFTAGTPVRLDTGTLAIEKVRPGHRVLAQNVDTGELTYKVVTAVTVRPPTAVMDVVAQGTHVTSTKGHPFWVNGSGWKMARELEVGDVIQSLQGPVLVEELSERDVPEPVYNLVVDDFHSYFVGTGGLLVHDNLPRTPTQAIAPGRVVSAAADQVAR